MYNGKAETGQCLDYNSLGSQMYSATELDGDAERATLFLSTERFAVVIT